MIIDILKHALELAREGVEIHNENSPEYKVCAALIATLEAKDEPVIDKSAAKRIATQLGWELPRKPLPEMFIVNAADQFDWDKDCAVRFARAVEAAHGIKGEA